MCSRPAWKADRCQEKQHPHIKGTRSEGQFSTGVFSKRAEDQGGIRAIGMHMILAQALSAAALRRLQAFAGGKLA